MNDPGVIPVCGETDAAVVTDLAAWELLTLATGFAEASLRDPKPPAPQVLQEAVRRTFPHPCNRAG